MILEWPLLVATVTQVLVQTTLSYRDMDRPCTFSPDCVPCPADVYCKCNHGRCVSLGPHPNDDPNNGLNNPKIPKECDEGGYKDCDCKYVSYIKRSFSKHALNLINSTQRQPSSLLLYWAWMQGEDPWECHTSADCARISAADDPSVSQSVFTITEKAPTRAFSWLKALLYLRVF